MCLAIPRAWSNCRNGRRADRRGRRTEAHLARAGRRRADRRLPHRPRRLRADRLDPDEAERTLATFARRARKRSDRMNGGGVAAGLGSSRIGRMKYIDEFRDGSGARPCAAIAREARPERRYNLMEFCGGHTHAISRYGLADLLPANVHMITDRLSVCVLPSAHRQRDRACGAPDDTGHLRRHDARAASKELPPEGQGGCADIRMVYSSADALRLAQEHAEREVVFFAIGSRHDAAHRRRHPAGGRGGAREFQRVLQPRAHAVRDHEHPRIEGGARTRHGALDGFIGPPTCRRSSAASPMILRRGISQARGHRRLRAARRDAGDPDARAPVERGRAESRTSSRAR